MTTPPPEGSAPDVDIDVDPDDAGSPSTDGQASSGNRPLLTTDADAKTGDPLINPESS